MYLAESVSSAIKAQAGTSGSQSGHPRTGAFATSGGYMRRILFDCESIVLHDVVQ